MNRLPAPPRMDTSKKIRESFRFIWLSEFPALDQRGIGYGQDGCLYAVLEKRGVGFTAKKMTLAESVKGPHDLLKAEAESGDGNTFDDDAIQRWLSELAARLETGALNKRKCAACILGRN